MTGLLGNIGAALGGLLGSPRAKDALLLSIASGGDPRFAAGLMGQRNEMQRANKQDELYQLKMEEARRKADEARLAQQRQQQSQSALASLSLLSPEYQAMYRNDPAFQQAFRANQVAYGDPAAAEQSGLLAPLPEAQKLPKEAMLYQMSQQDPKFAEWLRSQQAAGEGSGQYFAGVSVQMPDGTYAVVQPGNRPGMGPNVVPLPGAPLTYDPAVAAAIAAAQASGKVTGEAQGTRDKNAVDTAITMRELEAASADGGLIDKSTGSGFGAARDKAASYVGIATEGAQAIAQLAPLADRVLKTVPRFEGPQSDKDTQSYREAAGQLNDPTKPPEIRKAAAREILRLMRERQGQFGTTDDAGWSIVK